MTRRELAYALVIVAAIAVILTVAGRILADPARASGIEPPVATPLPASAFRDVVIPAAVPVLESRHLEADPGRQTSVALVSGATPTPRPTDAAVRDVPQTPAAATPLPAISRVTWYVDPRLGPDGLYGAAGDWHWGDAPYPVTLVRVADGRTYSVTVTVADACTACRDGNPLLDISPAAFRSLGVPLSVGVVKVSVSR